METTTFPRRNQLRLVCLSSSRDNDRAFFMARQRVNQHAPAEGHRLDSPDDLGGNAQLVSVRTTDQPIQAILSLPAKARLTRSNLSRMRCSLVKRQSPRSPHFRLSQR